MFKKSFRSNTLHIRLKIEVVKGNDGNHKYLVTYWKSNSPIHPNAVRQVIHSGFSGLIGDVAYYTRSFDFADRVQAELKKSAPLFS